MAKFGVNISTGKTHVSINTYEFAKRWIQRKIEISPLPLKGILSNLHQPQIVLQQLMVYCLKNNISFKGSTLDLLRKLYSRSVFATNGLIISPKRAYTDAYDFYYMLRYAYGIITPSELRLYFIKKGIPSDLICNEELILRFTRELLILGLSNQAERLGHHIMGMFNNFIEEFSSYHKIVETRDGVEYTPYQVKKLLGSEVYSTIISDFKSQKLRVKHGFTKTVITVKYDDFPIANLACHPITHGLYNRLRQIKLDMKKNFSNPDFNLVDSIIDMRVEQIDRLVALKRDSKLISNQMAKL